MQHRGTSQLAARVSIAQQGRSEVSNEGAGGERAAESTRGSVQAGERKRGKGETVYHMGFGESPFPVPERLEKALAEAAHRKEYLKADGLDDLTEAVREYYRPIYGDEYIEATEKYKFLVGKKCNYAVKFYESSFFFFKHKCNY